MQQEQRDSIIAYQIYPKSFQDTNGDGIGDLRGIIKRLDYLKSLGINVIWLCPVYQSPMKDNGYDISDYYQIDPRFGTMEDMEELISECEKRGIRILMDLVVNHCSCEHAWFQKALADPEGPYGEYFIMKKGSCGQPPNNWRSVFEGSVWEPVAGTDYYYYHTFAKEQPDLNWENEKLRREVYKMMNFWLEKGLGGFRVDAITYIKKDPSYRSLPADGADGLAGLSRVSENYPGIELFLREMREQTFDRYHAFSVAEMSGVTEEKLETFIGEDGAFSSIFDFSCIDLDVEDGLWFQEHKITAADIREAMYPMQIMAQQTGGMLSVVLGNHDHQRSLNKFIPWQDIGYESASMLATMNLTLRGIPFIYQGEEIGMTNITLDSIDEFDDVATHGQYDRAVLEGFSVKEALRAVNRRSRDHSRTPMQWDDGENAGFSEIKPWFPVNPDYPEVNVRRQEEQEKSVLKYYRALIALRNGEEYGSILRSGTFSPLYDGEEDIIAYRRELNQAHVDVLINFGGRERKIILEGQPEEVIFGNYKEQKISGNKAVLRPYEAMILR